MSGAPDISVVVTPSPHGARLGLTVRSALESAAASGRTVEVVVGLGGGDALLRAAAAELEGVRVEPGTLLGAHDAARGARGAVVVAVRAGDLLPRRYLGAMLAAVEDDGAAVARPAVVAAYGGAPAVRRQAPLAPGPEDRARVVFFPPFAPPLAARPDLLLRLPDHRFDLAAGWRWTLETLRLGVAHAVAPDATYVEWSPARIEPVLLPGAAEGAPDAAAERDRLQAELDALRGSTSWRITRPVRALISALRGGR